MASTENGSVAKREQIEAELVKLSTGERLLRLTEPSANLAIERKLDSQQPIHEQKERLLEVFEAALNKAETVA